MRPTTLILALLLATWSTGTGAAGGALGQAWHLLEIQAAGHVEAELSASGGGDMLLAIGIFDANGERRVLTTVANYPAKVEPTIEVAAAEAHVPWLTGNGPVLEHGSATDPTARLYVFFYAGAGVSEHSWSLKNATVIASWSGNEAYYSDGADFEGGTAARIDGPASRVAYEADRTYPLDIQGVFIGQIGSEIPHDTGVSEQRLLLEGPHGISECRCTSRSLFGANAYGPGSYLVHMNNLEATTLSGDDVLWGADVTFH